MVQGAQDLGMRAPGPMEQPWMDEAKKAISRTTGHDHVSMVASGNCAIMAVLAGIKGRVMVPDQGGWKGFMRYPDVLGLPMVKVETHLGVVEPETLEAAIRKERPKTFLLTSFAGYIADQDMKDISKICHENGVILVEDASGAVGDRKLCDGSISDVIVCSTGAPKIINLTSGGFISTNNNEILDRAGDMIKACKPGTVECAGITEEIKAAPRRVERLVEFSSLLKEELPDVIHQDRRGVCVGLTLDGIKPKEFVKRARGKGLVTDLGKGILTACPRYERFLENGVVVELKNLQVEDMEEEEVMEIAKILRGSM